jgi:hypothetical protein
MKDLRLGITTEQTVRLLRNELILAAKEVFECLAVTSKIGSRFHVARKHVVRRKEVYIDCDRDLEYTVVEDDREGVAYYDVWIRLALPVSSSGDLEDRLFNLLREGERLRGMLRLVNG